ncbi:hypothetical protein SISSUDRAFT_876294 [Sistotremastrum suecicum HHB10207 ss-3]|uniref:Uncharacterized protein n=1 Tax=Sistotremastrum suecicum HHB10207 ss-3 TaxID=1314776 RepID=A0A166CBN0_9AGAM|nr:hypothetical protein SISSUDRAFT_876294 [Sistotremastrum suecicum HHB10207 ss-3]
MSISDTSTCPTRFHRRIVCIPPQHSQLSRFRLLAVYRYYTLIIFRFNTPGIPVLFVGIGQRSCTIAECIVV